MELVLLSLLYQITAEQQALLRFLQLGWRQICRTHTCNQMQREVPREADNKGHNPTFLGNIAGSAGAVIAIAPHMTRSRFENAEGCARLAPNTISEIIKPRLITFFTDCIFHGLPTPLPLSSS